MYSLQMKLKVSSYAVLGLATARQKLDPYQRLCLRFQQHVNCL